MSKFEFHTGEIDRALAELYAVKFGILEQEINLASQRMMLYTQKSQAVEAMRGTIGRTQRLLTQQLTGTSQMILGLKQIKNDVSMGEVRACSQQIGLGGFLEAARLIFDVGWNRGLGRIFSPFANIGDFGNMPWWSPLAGGGVGLKGLGLWALDELSGNTKISGELFKTDAKLKKGLELKDGTIRGEVKGEASFSLLSGKMKSGLGLASSEISGDIGKVSASGSAKCALFQDGKLDPELSAELKASADALTVKNNNRFGTDDFNVHSEQQVSLGHAEAKLGAKINKDGVSASAKAGAYAAQGKVTTGFTFFGIKVDMEGSAKAGGASIGGEFNATRDSVSIGGEAGILAGLGIKIKISW